MNNYDGQAKNNFLDNFLIKFIKAEQTKIANFLANNPDVLAVNLAEEMLYVGLPVLYVAAITGISPDELNKLQQIKH